MEIVDRDIGPSRCQKLRNQFARLTFPLEAENHPLPDNPTRADRLKRAFFCPPFGRVGAFLLVASMFLLWWGVLISVTKDKALPGGVVFPMLMLFSACWCGGYLINLVHLPPLFGMLIMGGILGNVPGIDVGRDIDPDWSSTARNMALTVILTRAGLGLDPVALRKLSLVVLRLAFCPSLLEALVDGLAARLILGFPWSWSFMMAFVLSVVSPAVVVPSMLGLSDRGYGLDKGIPTLIVAAVSLDAVLAITGFGVCLGITFTSGDLVWTLFKGPLEAVVGIAFGCVGGVFLWYIPQRSSKNLTLFRSVMLFGGGLVSIFGSKYIKWSGAGPLACLAIAFVAGLRWRKEVPQGKKTPVEEVMGVLWMVFQPLLFGLIGAKVDLSKLEPTTVGYGVAVLFLGLLFRLIMAFVVVLRSDLNRKERFFVPITWLPKATVQAAIGGIALDTAIELGAGAKAVELGREVLTLAVLAIVITAPIGSLLIALIGPRLLHRTEPGQNTSVQTVEALERQEEKPGGNVNHAVTTDEE
ncbi:sodium/hydrogen exchanger 9B2-like [Babylonia areolata]|uniref:sodium/hydrogen exchanger 9B2-like n=1 Tax=Babylonia areolata TaxID=304850 RepID=UPI003FD3E9CE